MPWRRLMAVISDGAHADPVLDRALKIASEAHARIDVLHVRADPADAVPFVAEGISGAMVEDMMESAETDAKTRARDARAAFEAALGRHGVPEYSASSASEVDGACAVWVEVIGREEVAAAALGMVCDAAVMARPGADAEIPSVLTLNGVLTGSGRPVIVVPGTLPATFGRRVALAWNASTEAARALAAAMPLLSQAEHISVLIAEAPDIDLAGGEAVVETLRRHGLQPELRVFHPDPWEVASVLLGAALEGEADTLVMGAYTHSRLHRLILGGVTRYMLDRAGIHLLLAN